MPTRKQVTISRSDYLGGEGEEGAIDRVVRMIRGLGSDALGWNAEPVWATLRLDSETVEEDTLGGESIVRPTYTTASIEVLKTVEENK